MKAFFSKSIQESLPFPGWKQWLSISLATHLSGRPAPLRRYDQIHMRIDDLALHAAYVYRTTSQKRLLIMGDSDGLVLALELLASKFSQKLPGPSEIHFLDFDLRILNFYKRIEANAKWPIPLKLKKYNVFSPVLKEYLGYFDFFHTNPPYGQHNKGQSLMAFVDRCISMSNQNSAGIVVLANDESTPWTSEILFAMQGYIHSRNCVVTDTFKELHRYYLDDQPELKSGLMQFKKSISSLPAYNPDAKLPENLRERFYGRNTIPIPEFIPEDYLPENQEELRFFPE